MTRRLIRGAAALVAGALLACLPTTLAFGDVIAAQGAGVATGTAAFSGDSFPETGTSFQLSAAITGAVVNSAPSVDYNPQITASGMCSICSGFWDNSGPATGAASGVNGTGGSTVCPSLTGSYAQFGPTLMLNMSGDCTVNGFPTNLHFILSLAFTCATNTTNVDSCPAGAVPFIGPARISILV